MNSLKIAAALRVLANAFESDDETNQAQPAAEPQKRGRGRPVKGEETGVATPAATPTTTPVVAATASAAEADPFDSKPAAEPIKPVVPAATLDEVRGALNALKAATSQEKALGVLKTAGGADNLSGLAPANYGAVVAAAAAALPPIKTAPVAEEDPFAIPAEAAAPALTEDDVRAEVIASSKRTSQDTVAKVVMDAGGKAAGPDGVFKPSWKALPKDKYAGVIAALKALPTTK